MFHPQDTQRPDVSGADSRPPFIGSTCTLVSVLAALPSKDDAKVPVDGRTPLCLPTAQTAGHLGEGRHKEKGTPAKKSRLRNNPTGKSGQGPPLPHTSPLSAPVFLTHVHCLFERVPGFETTELNSGVRCY